VVIFAGSPSGDPSFFAICRYHFCSITVPFSSIYGKLVPDVLQTVASLTTGDKYPMYMPLKASVIALRTLSCRDIIKSESTFELSKVTSENSCEA
jgi:hypothetical protein